MCRKSQPVRQKPIPQHPLQHPHQSGTNRLRVEIRAQHPASAICCSTPSNSFTKPGTFRQRHHLTFFADPPALQQKQQLQFRIVFQPFQHAARDSLQPVHRSVERFDRCARFIRNLAPSLNEDRFQQSSLAAEMLISCDSLVPACREIADVLVCS